jgi:S1-C subfamily serine protease
MNKARIFLLQLFISIMAMVLLWTFIVSRERSCWERVYDRSDMCVVEIYALAIDEDNIGLASGTGFVYDLNGRQIIVTNRHVISFISEPLVRFRDGVEVIAKQLDASKVHDLAILGIEGINLKRYGELRPGRSSDLRIGEEVMTIGHPRLESHHISVGFYNGKSTNQEGCTLLRLSMAVDPGNSGGPLFNRKGQVVGIVSRKVEESANIAFAIPIEKAHLLNPTAR